MLNNICLIRDAYCMTFLPHLSTKIVSSSGKLPSSSYRTSSMSTCYMLQSVQHSPLLVYIPVVFPVFQQGYTSNEMGPILITTVGSIPLIIVVQTLEAFCNNVTQRQILQVRRSVRIQTVVPTLLNGKSLLTVLKLIFFCTSNN